jgi:hypothetical protein
MFCIRVFKLSGRWRRRRMRRRVKSRIATMGSSGDIEVSGVDKTKRGSTTYSINVFQRNKCVLPL